MRLALLAPLAVRCSGCSLMPPSGAVVEGVDANSATSGKLVLTAADYADSFERQESALVELAFGNATSLCVSRRATAQDGPVEYGSASEARFTVSPERNGSESISVSGGHLQTSTAVVQLPGLSGWAATRDILWYSDALSRFYFIYQATLSHGRAEKRLVICFMDAAGGAACAAPVQLLAERGRLLDVSRPTVVHDEVGLVRIPLQCCVCISHAVYAFNATHAHEAGPLNHAQAVLSRDHRTSFLYSTRKEWSSVGGRSDAEVVVERMRLDGTGRTETTRIPAAELRRMVLSAASDETDVMCGAEADADVTSERPGSQACIEIAPQPFCQVPAERLHAQCSCQLVWEPGCAWPTRTELTCIPPLPPPLVLPPSPPPLARDCDVEDTQVRVFLLVGQSNMQGFGLIAPTSIHGGDYTLEALLASGASEYQHLRDASGAWVQRYDVHVEQLDGARLTRSPLAVGLGVDDRFFGPELQFGHVVGSRLAPPVLLLKLAWGGVSLHADLRPPTAVLSRGGEVGPKYTELVSIVRTRLAALGQRGVDYELTGFGWHQGWNDGGSWEHVDEYEANLVDLMGDLRSELDAPSLPFIIAAAGMDGRASSSGGRRDALCEAQRAATLRRPFVNSTRYVETRDYARPREASPNPSQGYHWSWNAESVFRIGNAMAVAALQLVCSSSIPPLAPSPPLPVSPPAPPPQPPRAPTANVNLAVVYLAQTHVVSPESARFRLVGGRAALLKVQLTGTGSAPLVQATVTAKSGAQTSLTLEGPSSLQPMWDGEPGRVEHKLEDSFTATIPAPWVAHGMVLQVHAADQIVRYELTVGAPSELAMLMYDVHYFGTGSGDYPSGWEAELASKWPVASFDVQRIRGVRFLELVVPARPEVGAPAVRVASQQDYADQTGLGFDGEQAAALQWVHALSAAGGNADTQMCYINILGVPAGGQAGSFDGVGAVSAGILNHELGHAFSLPHWGEGSSGFPYRGDMHGIMAPGPVVHVGPTWAFDLASMTFLPPTCQTADSTLTGCEARGLVEGETPPRVVYKQSPMQGGGTGDQPAPFLFRHFSDYGVRQMQDYIESKLAVNVSGGWRRWDDDEGAYTQEVAPSPVRYPVATGVAVVSLMAACTGASDGVSMVYPPIGPYTGSMIRLFDANRAIDRADASRLYCPNAGCDFSLRVHQGGSIVVYLLAASADSLDPYSRASLATVAINLLHAWGDVMKAELLATPDAQTDGPPAEPAVLHAWVSDVRDCADLHHPATAAANVFEGALRHGDVADFQAAQNEYVEWVLAGCAAGDYWVSFDYYAGTCDRPLRLSVDGVVVASELSFASTGGWSILGTTARTKLTLAGSVGSTVRVRLESIGYSGNNLLRMSLHTSPAHAPDAGGATDGGTVGCTFFSKATGGRSCAAGAVVDTEATCRQAAAEISMPFAKSVNQPDGRPAGCFWDRNGYCYFNAAHATSNVWGGTGGVCQELPAESLDRY